MRLLPSFQARVVKWLVACFGEAKARDRVRARTNFALAALALARAAGCTRTEMHRYVDSVCAADLGDVPSEAGGVALALAELCEAHGVDGEEAGILALGLAWANIGAIRVAAGRQEQGIAVPSQNVAILPCVRRERV